MKILSPAKINIFIKVLGKRSDGYHELLTLMVPVSLFDEIILEKEGHDINIHAPDCGCDSSENIAYKAAKLFFESTGINKGVTIFINKNIPFGAGLGGGSSNAAHTLIGLNELFGTALNEDALCLLASKIGADCPFFIHGRPALMGERGDKRLFDVTLEDRAYLLILPPLNISTAKVYSALKIPLTMNNFTFKMEDIKNGIIAPERYLFNELECIAFRLYPELKIVKEELLNLGAVGALMSGSGSSVFGMFRDTGHLENAMGKLVKREGYRYIPTTRAQGGVNGNYRG